MAEWVLIAARDHNGVIGVKGELPWHLPNDFRYFKQTTLGHPIVMGRKTYDSIGRPLPGRRNVVLTRDPAFSVKGVETVSSLSDCEAAFEEAETVFIIGGGEIYHLFLPMASRVLLTEVEVSVPEGDAHFPVLPERFREIRREVHEADERHAYAYAFVEYAQVP